MTAADPGAEIDDGAGDDRSAVRIVGTRDHRVRAGASRRDMKVELDQVLAKRSLDQHLPDARTRCLQIARDHEQPLPTRTKAAVALLSLRLVSRSEHS